MTIANINGVNLNYEVAGQGKAVVLLHGHTGSTQDWANQIPVLSPKYQVIALDHRGHGKSAAPSREEEYSIRTCTDAVFALLRMLNIKQCCLVGHSLGGFIALEFALEHQDMLAALVLVDTSTVRLARDPNYVQLREKLDELARSQGMETVFEYDVVHNPQRIEWFQEHPELKEASRRKMLMTSVEGYLYAIKAATKWGSITPRLSEIKVPTLIYWGNEDLLLAKATQILKKEIANSELVTVNGAGHSPHEEAPDVFNETLLKFLDRIKW